MLDTSLAGSDLSSRFLHPGRCQQPFQGRHPHGLVLARPILFPPEDQALCPERRDEPTIGVHPAMGCSTSNTYNQIRVVSLARRWIEPQVWVFSLTAPPGAQESSYISFGNVPWPSGWPAPTL